MSYENSLFILYIIAGILVIVEQFIGKDITYKYNYFFIILMIVVAAFRSSTATPDTGMYESYFFDIPSIWEWINNGASKITDIPFEYGYIVLNSLVKNIIEEPVIVFFIMATISLNLYYFTFKELSPYPMLSIFCYITFLYIFREVVQIRNGMACAMTLYALKYIYYKDLRKYIISVLIASSFHLTALIALFFYPLSLINWTREKYIIFLVSSLCIFNIDWIYEFMNVILSNGTLFYRIAKYQGDNVAMQDVNLYKYFTYIGMAVLFFRKVEYKNKLYNTLLMIFCVGVFIQGGFHEFREMADRLSSICYTTLFLLIPLYLKMERYKWMILLILMIVMPLYYVRTVHWLQKPF